MDVTCIHQFIDGQFQRNGLVPAGKYPCNGRPFRGRQGSRGVAEIHADVFDVIIEFRVVIPKGIQHLEVQGAQIVKGSVGTAGHALAAGGNGQGTGAGDTGRYGLFHQTGIRHIHHHSVGEILQRTLFARHGDLQPFCGELVDLVARKDQRSGAGAVDDAKMQALLFTAGALPAGGQKQNHHAHN